MKKKKNLTIDSDQDLSEILSDFKIRVFKGKNNSATVSGFYLGKKILTITESTYEDYIVNKSIATVDATKKFINIVKLNMMLNIKKVKV